MLLFTKKMKHRSSLHTIQNRGERLGTERKIYKWALGIAQVIFFIKGDR